MRQKLERPADVEEKHALAVRAAQNVTYLGCRNGH